MDRCFSSETIVFFAFVISLPYSCPASENRISLKKAMATKLITVNAISTGGYCDKSLKLDLKNNTKSEITIDIDPGLIFRPQDTTFQDLVVLGNESIVLAPSSSKDITLQTFCGKSYARSPYPNHPYHYIKQADSGLIKTLSYVKLRNIDMYLAQKAVWSFTNGYSINSIFTYENYRGSEDFVKFVATIKKEKMPEYFVDYKLNNTAGGRAIIAGQSKVYALVHWGLEEGYRNMHLTIFKENGEIYKTIEADQVIDKYGFTVTVQFDPKLDPKGVYLVKVFDDANKVWDQKTVIVDPAMGDRP